MKVGKETWEAAAGVAEEDGQADPRHHLSAPSAGVLLPMQAFCSQNSFRKITLNYAKLR